MLVEAVEPNAILEIMEILDYTLIPQGNIIAYKDRANREMFQFRPSATAGIVTDLDGFLNLEENTISKIEIVSGTQKISTDSTSVKAVGSKLFARLGDLNLEKGKNPFSIIFYVGSDQRGLVVTSVGTSGYKQMEYMIDS